VTEKDVTAETTVAAVATIPAPETPQDTALTPYLKKGLTLTEAKVLSDWIEAGKPGLLKQRAEGYGQIYALGYTCEEIQKWFPNMPLPLLLYARVQFNWDDTRERYRVIMQGRALEAAVGSRNESIRLMADTIAATNMQWRRKLMDYLADPDKNKAPDFLPDTLASYQRMVDMLENLAFPKEVNKPLPSQSGPLVNINVGAPQGVQPQDVAATLIAEMQGKKV
jgi:hypothetical protein